MASTQIKSYIIYNPMYRQIKKYIKRQTGKRNFIVNTWNVGLFVRDDILDMKLVWVRAESDEFIKFIDTLVDQSNSFLPWQKFPNILVTPENYQGLKDFISVNKLWRYIEKIETKTNIRLIRSTIKLITFHPRIREKNILETYKRPMHLRGHFSNSYIAKAYSWLKPNALQHFDKKISYRFTHLVLYLLLDYYRTQIRRKNKRVLNLFDLCSLRLAMFDPRYYQFDQCEIPNLIHAELSHIINREQKIDKQFVFDPTTYLVENGVREAPKVAAEYFLFYVSSYSTVSQNIPDCNNFSQRISVLQYVKLYTEDYYGPYLIHFIQKRPFLNMWIDGRNAPMSANLILQIISFANVFDLRIDTDLPTVFDDFEPMDIANFEDKLNISFCGNNENRTVENCIPHIKQFLKFRPYTLYLQCPVTDYTILNEIQAQKITFFRHSLTAKMISQLQNIKLINTTIRWIEGRLENDPRVLQLLHKFPLVVDVDIVQDENTFELLFGFIGQQLQLNDCTEFNFNGSYSVRYKILNSGVLKLNFKNYSFRYDEYRLKIEMVDRRSDEVVDLYELLYCSELPEMDFDFYQ